MKKRSTTATAIPEIKRIGVYMRVSSGRQARDGDSLDAQKNIIDHFIQGKGWTVESAADYVDPGRSAKDQNRPRFQDLKRDIVAGKINTVICLKLDRVTRSLRDFTELWEFFKEHGVEMISVTCSPG